MMALVALAFPKKSHGGSPLEWEQTKVQVELEPGEDEARAEFVATNISNKTVRIERVKTSCGCTGSVLSKKQIKPGESATIVGTFRKGNRSGLNHNRLEVFLKNHPNSVETLHMLVQVPKLIDAQPSIVFWNRSSPRTERSVNIKLDKRHVDTISEITYDSELITVTKQEVSDGTADYTLSITPKSFEQQLRHTLRIEAKGSDDLVAETKIQIFVQP